MESVRHSQHGSTPESTTLERHLSCGLASPTTRTQNPTHGGSIGLGAQAVRFMAAGICHVRRQKAEATADTRGLPKYCMNSSEYVSSLHLCGVHELTSKPISIDLRDCMCHPDMQLHAASAPRWEAILVVSERAVHSSCPTDVGRRRVV